MEDAELTGDGDAVARHLAENEWQHLTDTFTTTGLREGIDSGKESVLQSAFNQGFADASSVAFDLGQLRGVLCTLLALDERYRPFNDEHRQQVNDLYKRVCEFKCTRELKENEENAANALTKLQKEVGECLKGLGYEMAL